MRIKGGRLFSCEKGALKNFDLDNVIVKMSSKYFHNTANYLLQEDIDKLINAPKVRVQNLKVGKNKLINLSTSFNRINNSDQPNNKKTGKKKKGRVYFGKDIEYYSSIVDGNIELFAVTFTKREGINSVALTYLPEGKVENAIFLARVCYHPADHFNKLEPTVIKGKQVHLHKASQRFYEEMKIRKQNSPPDKLAKIYVDPDAVVLEPIDGINDVKYLARKLFKLGGLNKSINISTGKDSMKILKRDIERNS